MGFDSVDMNYMWLNVHVDSLVIFVGTLYLAILATNKHHATQQVSDIHKKPVIRTQLILKQYNEPMGFLL